MAGSPSQIHANAVAVVLALLRLPSVGRRTALRMLAGVDRPKNFQDFSSVVSRMRNKAITADDGRRAWSFAESILDKSARQSISIVSLFDELYPASLKAIEDPPLLLHIKGEARCLVSSPSIAIIGTREPTQYGRSVARKIGATVAAAGATVISGLARGCDAEAHWGCVEAHGRAVAVLAHGLDRIYPAENRDLAKAILDAGGCLISEYEIGKPPFRTSFIERDRLQSGLSKAVIVIETGIKGGSQHTIKFAREQGRVIACIKHPDHMIGEEKVAGNEQLIREGIAIPIRSGEDLQQLLFDRLHVGGSSATIGDSANGSGQSRGPKQLSLF